MNSFMVDFPALEQAQADFKRHVNALINACTTLSEICDYATGGDCSYDCAAKLSNLESTATEAKYTLMQRYNLLNTVLPIYNAAEQTLERAAKLTEIYYSDREKLAGVYTLDAFIGLDGEALSSLGYEGFDLPISVNTPGQYVNILDYNNEVPDLELLLLASLVYGVSEENPSESFARLLNEKLPDSSPLKYITPEQIEYISLPDCGLNVVVISDGDAAIVLFQGTDTSSLADIVTDAEVLFNLSSLQQIHANSLIKELSEKYDNIVVGGHSLGGYLAMDVTLSENGDSITRCVASDPIGTLTDVIKAGVNSDKAEKIKNYTNKGSITSLGYPSKLFVGDVELVDLNDPGFELTFDFQEMNHGCREETPNCTGTYEALGGNEATENEWNKKSNL